MLLATVATLASAQAGTFSFYDLHTASAGPCDLVEGPDGNLWGEAILANIIFRINPSTGEVDEFNIPFTVPPLNLSLPVPPQDADRTEFSCAIRTGHDGNLYASNGLRNQLIRIVPSATPSITAFTPQPYNALGDLQPFNDLYSSADGIYFTQTSGNVVSFFSFAAQEITKNFEVPTPLSFPLGVYVASNGLTIIAELIGNKILFLNGTSGDIEEYALPEAVQGPAVVRAETENHDIYFSLFTGNGVGRINLYSKDITIFHTNLTGALGAEDTIDSQGRIWLSFFDINALGIFDPATDEFSFVEFPDIVDLPQGSGFPPYIDVAVNYGPGDAIWFTDISGNRVGRYSLS